MCTHAQLCPLLCDSMGCSPSGPSIHGIFQARGLEWVAISYSRGSSRPRDWSHVSCMSSALAGGFFTTVSDVVPTAAGGGQPHLFFSALPRLTPHNRGCAQFFSWVQGDVSLSVETFSLWVEKGLPSLKALLSCIFNYFLSPCALFKGDEPGQISPIT